MAVPFGRKQSRKDAWSQAAICLLVAVAACALPCLGDEIRLKDGKKLYGVIVAYEENMFKVKTDFGYVLVEKDKIASIIPMTPQGPQPDTDAKQAKNGGSAETKPGTNLDVKKEAAGAGSDAKATVTNTSERNSVAGLKRDNAGAKAASPAKTDSPANASVNGASAAANKSGSKPSNATPASGASLIAGAQPQPVGSAPANQGGGSATAAVAQPTVKPPEAPREEVQGNLYINRAEGFRMFKAPSWQLIEGAQNALPNAIMAMGTPEQSTLMVVGREKTKEPLDAAANGVERRLHEVYQNYRLISTKKATVAGSPAIEFHYAGKADEHDWSGTLVVISRGAEIFTVLGMTYADSDLIQIQENVIGRAVASLSFDVK